jgi:hypothetical protein
MKREEWIVECKRRHENGEGMESLIRFLRDSGCPKVDSITILASACGIRLGEAKKAVHYSPVWADVRASHDKFHENLIKTITTDESKE